MYDPARFFYVHDTTKAMDPYSTRGGAAALEGQQGRICWFCSKDRHGDCMGQIPVQGGADGGPHDCAFDTSLVACRCGECDHRPGPGQHGGGRAGAGAADDD